MSFSDKKGITVASGFKLQAAALLDAREQVNTIAERDELVTLNAVTEGLKVYVKETKTLYVWNGTGWDEVSKGSGYTHPDAPGYKHLPAGGTTGQVLKNKADGEAEWADETTYSRATQSADGLMSKDDKKKLDGVDTGAQVNMIEEISVNGTPVSPVGKKVNLEVLVASDLENYYNKMEVDQKISSIPKFSISVVAALPTSSISDTTVYLLKTGDEEQNLYTEYIYANGKWETLGTQTVDLSDYVTKSNAISGAKAKNATTITFTRADGSTFDITITGTTYSRATQSADGLMSKEDKKKLDGVEENANNYTHPQNHSASMIVQDETHRFVSDAEKEKWNAKPEIFFGSELPDNAPAGSICFLI